MQVARNFFLGREKTYMRKLNEIFLALKIEKDLSKDEILELYLNKIYLGQRAYGIATAAYIYYGKTLQELDLSEMAMLAGLPKAPSTTNPITNPAAATQRRQYVLDRMLKVGFINEQEHTTAVATPTTAELHSTNIELEASYVAEMVRADLYEQLGDEAYTKGYKVYTTIVDKNQLAANQAVQTALINYDERHGYRGAESRVELNEQMAEADWQEILRSFSVVARLYPALVVEVNEKDIKAFTIDHGLVEVHWDNLKWAREYKTENARGAPPSKAADILAPGDIIRIIENQPEQWRLSQIPEVEGSLVSLNPNNGETLALVGGFDFLQK